MMRLDLLDWFWKEKGRVDILLGLYPHSYSTRVTIRLIIILSILVKF